MKRILLFSTILMISSISFLLTLNISMAVYFAHDSVLIYENGKKISDDSIIYVTSYGTYSQKCTKGVCIIGQQDYPVILFKAKDNLSLLTHSEFISQYPNRTDEEGPGTRTWYHGYLTSYIIYLYNNSEYNILFNPGPSEGGEGCGTPDCFGGRIGNYRDYTLDIANGTYKKNSENEGKIVNANSNFYFIVGGTIIVFLVAYFILRKKKLLRKKK